VHLQNYHGVLIDVDTTFADISKCFLVVFDEVSDNLEWYLKCLEVEEDI
jgi:heat shock protein HspQ